MVFIAFLHVFCHHAAGMGRRRTFQALRAINEALCAGIFGKVAYL